MAFVEKHIKVVLFDHDDTLIGTFGPKSAHHKHVARLHYGKELTNDEIIAHWGKPLHELVCLLYGTTNVEQALAYNKASHVDFPKQLFTATIPTLKQLKKQQIRIGIVTATSRFSFMHDLTLHEIPIDLLDYTQTADDTTFHKPDPRVFDPVLGWLSDQRVKPQEVLYVGDGLHDMKAALGAGFEFLGVETGLVSAEEFKQAGAKSISGIEILLND